MKLVLFLLAATSAFGAAVLSDDVVQISPGGWRWVRFEIGHRPATVQCHFETVGGGDGEARAELLNRPDLELLRQHKRPDALKQTDALRAGEFSQYLEESGEYAVVIENPGSQTVAVHLNVALAFGAARPVSRTLSPERRITVILVSFAMFFAIVTFSARALLRAMNAGRSSVDAP
jgi:hypothetical protein